MYVRWNRRHGTRLTWNVGGPNAHGKGYKETLSAVVVESRRVNGKPSQRMVKYLGSIQATDTTNPSTQRDFWNKITPLLDALPMNAAQRLSLEKAILAVVPQPTPEAFTEAMEEGSAALAPLEKVLARYKSGIEDEG